MSGLFPVRFTAEVYLDANKLNVRRWDIVDDDMHGHEFFELCYVLNGTATHQMGAQTFHVTRGDYFIIGLDSFHCYREVRDFEVINCLFAPEYVSHALFNCPSLSMLLSAGMQLPGMPVMDPADRIYHDESNHVRRLIQEMESEYRAHRIGYLEMIRCYLIEILLHAIRAPIIENGVSRYHPAVAAMAQQLGEHFTKPLALTQLSAKLGYTPQYLCNLFHKETGMTPGAYLQKLRAEKSCHLLAESKMTVSAIAQEMGYSDTRYFSAMFRSHIGLSPREFRARTRKKASPLAVL